MTYRAGEKRSREASRASEVAINKKHSRRSGGPEAFPEEGLSPGAAYRLIPEGCSAFWLLEGGRPPATGPVPASSWNPDSEGYQLWTQNRSGGGQNGREKLHRPSMLRYPLTWGGHRGGPSLTSGVLDSRQ
ncbi:hypothetical protein GN956_G16089 [Arapaima gigas]